MTEQLKYFLSNLYMITDIPCSIWNTDSNSWIWSKGLDTLYYANTAIDLSEDILNEIKIQQNPIIISKDEKIFFGICYCSDHYKAVLGPVSMIEVSDQEKNEFKKKYHIEMEISDDNFLKKSIYNLAQTLGLIYHYYSGNNVNCEDIISHKSVDKILREIDAKKHEYSLNNSENKKENHAFYNTQKIKQIVMNGDTEALEREISLVDFENMGIFTASNYKRFEYMAVNSANIHAQAAVEGGLPSSVAFDLCDVYTRRIEACHTLADLHQIMLAISRDFTNRVKEYKEQRRDSSYVERCKDYVIKNLNQPISLQSVATHLHLSKYYLSRIFYEKEKIHLHDYINRERINAASNMLKYSDFSLVNIASYFCFGSQSHFGTVFKKYQGITPRQYRDRYQMLDFMSDLYKQ